MTPGDIDLALDTRLHFDHAAEQSGQAGRIAAMAHPHLCTSDIKDFTPLDAQYRAAGQAHAGLILVSARTFPQNRSYASAVASALAALFDEHEQIEASHVTFLTRH
jgi:hypothetical protein